MIKIIPLLTIISVLFACDKETPSPMETIIPTVSMEPISVLEGTNESSVFISLRLSQSIESNVDLILSTSDGTAKANEDYIGFSNKSITIAANGIQESCKITILGDELYEQNESFSLEIVSASGATIATQSVDITIENDDFDLNVNIPNTGYSTPENYENRTLLWQDEFEGDVLDETNWTYEIGNGSSGWGNNELQYYREENTFLQEGHLVIQAREESFAGFKYTSSRLITKDKFEFTHGRVDIRAALPEGQGIWPALWMLGANISEVGWPRCGEIDIMELVGHAPSTVHGTVHYPDPAGNRIFIGDEISLNSGKFSDEFHVFSVIWEENSIEWYMDDQKYFSVTNQSLGAENPYPFNESFFFIFNVAVGGNWPGAPDETTRFSQNMIVDYIRVFQ